MHILGQKGVLIKKELVRCTLHTYQIVGGKKKFLKVC